MKIGSHSLNENGFSLIEVMVGASVFIVGFSILAGSVDRAFSHLPIKEDCVAVTLTESAIAEVWAGDTNSIDSLVSFDGLEVSLRRTVFTDSVVTGCEVVVAKPRSGQEIMRTVYEMSTPVK